MSYRDVRCLDWSCSTSTLVSRGLLLDELQRCEMLGLVMFTFHPGELSTCRACTVELPGLVMFNFHPGELRTTTG